MAFKAVFVLASALALATALPGGLDDQGGDVQVVPVEVPASTLAQYAQEAQYAQDRGDLLVAADESGWGQPAVQVGWSPPPKIPIKFKYLRLTIPIPILPRIKFGIKGGLKLNAAIQAPKGGWRR